MYDDLSDPVIAGYRVRLRAFAGKHLRGQEADDVAQEAITRLLERRDQLDLQRSPLPWLLTVTRNLCRDVRRSHLRVSVAGEHELDALNPRTAPSALDVALSHERSETVADALRKLSPRDRELIFRRLVDDWSYVQLADHLGASVNTVRQQFHRAKERLLVVIGQGRELALLAAIRLRLRRGDGAPAQLPTMIATAVAQAAVPVAVVLAATPALAGHLAGTGHRSVPATSMSAAPVRGERSLFASGTGRALATRPAATNSGVADRPRWTEETTQFGPADAGLQRTREEQGDPGEPGSNSKDTYVLELGDQEIPLAEHGHEEGSGPGLLCRLRCRLDD